MGVQDQKPESTVKAQALSSQVSEVSLVGSISLLGKPKKSVNQHTGRDKEQTLSLS